VFSSAHGYLEPGLRILGGTNHVWLLKDELGSRGAGGKHCLQGRVGAPGECLKHWHGVSPMWECARPRKKDIRIDYPGGGMQ